MDVPIQRQCGEMAHLQWLESRPRCQQASLPNRHRLPLVPNRLRARLSWPIFTTLQRSRSLEDGGNCARRLVLAKLAPRKSLASRSRNVTWAVTALETRYGAARCLRGTNRDTTLFEMRSRDRVVSGLFQPSSLLGTGRPDRLFSSRGT
jgi:hypothetical protein